MLRLALLLALAACTSSPSYCPDEDLDGYASCDDAGPDCNDADPFAHPGAAERCNGADDDCDGDANTDEVDLDADGALDCAADCDPADPLRNARDDDGDGFSVCRGDCDDNNPTHHPGAEERCDLLDNDCDGVIDDGFPLEPYYVDVDADGYGDQASPVFTCRRFSADRIPTGGDCDDQRPEVNAGITELCNGLDDNCDGEVDEPAAADAAIYYRDADGDGAGDAITRTRGCTLPPGHVLDGLDCDDTRADRAPQLGERCDQVDNDCDAVVDEQAVDQVLTWLDDDGDGFGANGSGAWMCFPGPERVQFEGDCDDSRATVSPAGIEVCDGRDQDCDGLTDEYAIDRIGIHPDSDADGFGDRSRSRLACDVEGGWTTDATDCQDDDPSIHPGADERCNRRDDDCDGAADEGAIDVAFLYRDNDGDGHGGEGNPRISLCSYAGATTADDCDDTNSRRYPGNPEVCDLLDNNCDDLTDNLANSEPIPIVVSDGPDTCGSATFALDCTECGGSTDTCPAGVSTDDGAPPIEVGPLMPGRCSTLHGWITGTDRCKVFEPEDDGVIYTTMEYCYNTRCSTDGPDCVELNSCSSSPGWRTVCSNP
jgi:hypothetical protein